MNDKPRHNTPEEIIKIVQAYLAGEQIEVRSLLPSSDWGTSNSPCWDFSNYQYRVKKEPREFWVVHWCDNTYSVQDTKPMRFNSMKEIIHVKEVK